MSNSREARLAQNSWAVWTTSARAWMPAWSNARRVKATSSGLSSMKRMFKRVLNVVSDIRGGRFSQEPTEVAVPEFPPDWYDVAHQGLKGYLEATLFPKSTVKLGGRRG